MEKTMTSSQNVDIDQGRSFTRPLLFHGSNIFHWEKLTHIFIKDFDYELWEIISKGDFVPIVKEGLHNKWSC